MTTRTLFIELSEALTGVADLPHDLAAEYEERLRASGFTADLEALLAAFSTLKEEGSISEESLAATLFATAELKAVAQQLIVLWYSSALMNIEANKPVELKFGPPEHHFRALLWDVIAAHPPALSGGYFGHWHYPPEN
jgi:hypothetical protein